MLISYIKPAVVDRSPAPPTMRNDFAAFCACHGRPDRDESGDGSSLQEGKTTNSGQASSPRIRPRGPIRKRRALHPYAASIIIYRSSAAGATYGREGRASESSKRKGSAPRGNASRRVKSRPAGGPSRLSFERQGDNLGVGRKSTRTGKRERREGDAKRRKSRARVIFMRET